MASFAVQIISYRYVYILFYRLFHAYKQVSAVNLGISVWAIKDSACMQKCYGEKSTYIVVDQVTY